MEKYERMTEEKIIAIANLIPCCENATELAKETNSDTSCLIKHLKTYRVLVETSSINKCGRKYACPHSGDLCSNCRRKEGKHPEPSCASCKKGCNQLCAGFTKIPECPRLLKYPYVCNGCEKAKHCHLSHYYYEPSATWKAVKEARSGPRRGARLKNDDFMRLSTLLTPLIKEKKQSLPQIFLTHKEEIGCSYPTLLRYIDLQLIPGIRNIDLTKRVKYPKSYKKRKSEPTNAASLAGRTYDDFVTFITESRPEEIVEMDTVLSGEGGRKCLLTFLFRKSNYMMAFLLDSKESSGVSRVFADLRKSLGTELFKKTFACILTDNGSEFCDAEAIEFDPSTGERLCRLFYCDPGKSGQKGKIEKNHVELRKVFPKGTIFDGYTQMKVNLALSHVNSEPRAILNGNCPGKICRIWLDEKVLAANEYEFIEPDSVFLSPELVG